MQRVIVPRAPGHFCAFGMLVLGPALRLRAHLVCPARRRFVRRHRRNLRIADRGRKEGGSERAACRSGGPRFSRAVDMRYVGQEHPVTVGCPRSFPPPQPRRVETELRRGAPAALRHLRAGGTRRDREPARDGDRRDEEPRLERIARGGRAPPASARRGSAACTSPSSADRGPTPSYAREGLRAGKPHRGAGTHRGTRVDDRRAAGRPPAGGWIRQPRHQVGRGRMKRAKTANQGGRGHDRDRQKRRHDGEIERLVDESCCSGAHELVFISRSPS